MRHGRFQFTVVLLYLLLGGCSSTSGNLSDDLDSDEAYFDEDDDEDADVDEDEDEDDDEASSSASSGDYGCWCGAGYPAAGSNPRPVDDWDRACMRHDKCYDTYGDGNPGCDRRFMDDLMQVSRYWGQPIPGQLQLAESYFFSRMTRTATLQAYFQPQDIFSWLFSKLGGVSCEEY
jgi:hypothetical protein